MWVSVFQALPPSNFFFFNSLIVLQEVYTCGFSLFLSRKSPRQAVYLFLNLINNRLFPFSEISLVFNYWLISLIGYEKKLA